MGLLQEYNAILALDSQHSSPYWQKKKKNHMTI